MRKSFENIYRELMESPQPGVLEPPVKPDVKPDVKPTPSPAPAKPGNPFAPQPGRREKTKPKARSGVASAANKLLTILSGYYNGKN